MIPIYRLRFASESQYTAAMAACSLADDPRILPILVNVGRDDEGVVSTMFHVDLIVQGLPDLPAALKQFAVTPSYPKHVFSGIELWSEATHGLVGEVIEPTGDETVELSTDEEAVILGNAEPWVQPQGAHDAIPAGTVRSHNGALWTSLVDANVWEPGIANWRATWEPATVAPTFIQPTGAGDAYPEGFVVTFKDELWRSTLAANVWQPGVTGWVKLGEEAPEEPEAPAEWVQPTGGHDAYAIGDLVTFQGAVYRSLINGNVWNPATYPAGWAVV